MDGGALYSWGGNEYGEQGNKKRVIQDKPKLLKRYSDMNIVSINCSLSNSAVIYTRKNK